MATQTELDAIRSAYYQGVQEVTYNNRTVKYRSLSEMKQIINDLEKSLGTTKANSIAISTDRGFR